MPLPALEQPDHDVAVCRAGLEAVVAAELSTLGLEVVFTGVRMVAFRGDKRGRYLACRALRSAVQVLHPLRRFRARDPDRLYHQARKTPWHKWFSPERTLRVDVKGSGAAELRDQRFATYRLKDAIVDTFRKLCDGQRPGVSRDEPEVRVLAYLHRDEVTLYLDAAGAPLNERGYRLEAGEAPLKEDLAAGLLTLAGYDGSGPFVDPLAGSGTLAIEAALLAMRRAPNRDRAMAYQHWEDYDAVLDAGVTAELKAAERPALPAILACESDAATAAICSRNAARAGVAEGITLHGGPFAICEASLPGAMVVTNPPYGERLPVDARRLYQDLDTWLRATCPGGRLALFTPRTLAVADLLDLPVHRRIAGLMNGQLPAMLTPFTIPATLG